MTMTELLASLIPWGTDAILWVQSFRHPFLDALFLAATFLGEEEFYLIFLPFIYWCLNKQVGVGLAYISIFSTYLNSVVKLTFGLPRPSDPRLVLLRTETSPSFPSNHAQGAVVNWGYLVTQFRHKIFSIVAVVLILLIAFSRIYVGVHFPQDVVGGLLIGLLLLVAYNWVVGTIEKRRFDLPLMIKLALSVVVPLALLFVHPFDVDGTYPAELAATTMGTFLGMSIGFILEQGRIRFKVDGLWWKRGLRFILGMVLVIIFYLGLKVVSPEEVSHSVAIALRMVRYSLVGFSVAFLAPWLFVATSLAEREETEKPSGNAVPAAWQG
jgi:membrane-associated phospholipid phosphatase